MLKFGQRDETPTRVRALTASAGVGPGTTFGFGEVFDAPAWRARELVAGGALDATDLYPEIKLQTPEQGLAQLL